MGLKTVEPPRKLDDFKEITKTHIELCEQLHNKAGGISPVLFDELADLIYRHYEP